jgi:hypothetical protein
MRLPAAGRDFGIIKATSKNVIPAPIFIGINSSRNPDAVPVFTGTGMTT